jgi:1-acyl-sn-glycerol-3-phosphate acyltransferase
MSTEQTAPEDASARATQIPPAVPRVASRWRKVFGVIGLRLARWQVTGNMPNLPKFVIVVAPHTSNWDFFFGFLTYLALQLEATWLAKESAFRWPFGPIARRFGGSPIDRSRASNVVDAYIEEFARRERMVLVITPEGTRKKVPEWKRGFYFVAVGAAVPIVPVALDYPARRVRIGPAFTPTGDLANDLPRIKAFFSKEMAQYPERY